MRSSRHTLLGRLPHHHQLCEGWRPLSPEGNDDVKALFVRRRSSLSAPAVPWPRQVGIHLHFSRCHPRHRYSAVSHGFLSQIPGPHAFGHTPHHSVSAPVQRLLSDEAAPLVRHVPHETHRMQLSYCFHGATATHRSSVSITSPARCSHTLGEAVLRARPWSFCPTIARRYSRPRSNVPFTCMRAFG